jgi:hypothetical protein
MVAITVLKEPMIGSIVHAMFYYKAKATGGVNRDRQAPALTFFSE